MSYRILPGVPPVERLPNGRERMVERPWLTAKAYRALGVPIPDRIADDEVIDLEVVS